MKNAPNFGLTPATGETPRLDLISENYQCQCGHRFETQPNHAAYDRSAGKLGPARRKNARCDVCMVTETTFRGSEQFHLGQQYCGGLGKPNLSQRLISIGTLDAMVGS
jgi:hypothetical protein